MKKIFLLPIIFICLILTQLTSFSSEQTQKTEETLKFNNEVYYLKYSKTSPTATINEYTRKAETVYDWDKLLAVRHWNNVNIKLKKYIKESYDIVKDDYIPLAISCDDNIAYVCFLMLSNDYLEYNCWKYIAKDKEILAIQYAKKFKITKKTTIEKVMKQVQAHHSEIMPIMNSDLNIEVKFLDIGEE